MELRQLERFLAVADHGSLAAAARRLGLTQQALSASLANLEGDLGVRLFDRSPGGITRATACGRALIPHARAQLAAAARAREELRSLAEGRAGTVTIGVGESFDGEVICSAINRLRQARPQVRVNLVEGYSEQLRERLYDGEFDFIAAGASAFELAEGYTRELVYAAQDVVVARPEHPLAGRRRLRLADLAGFAWLVPHWRTADLEVIVATFVAAGLEPPRSIVGSDAYRIGLRLLCTGDLLMMVPPALIRPELAQRPPVLVRLDIGEPTVLRNASLIYPRERPLTPAATQLLELIRRQGAESGALG